jgi:3-deoxy-D-manno-octulosonic-acid transferase
MLRLYRWLWRLLLPGVFLRLAWRGVGNRDYWRRWPERLGFVSTVTGAPVIWIHAVSVGEVRATVPLVRALRQRYRQCAIVLTTTTPTGSAQARTLFGDQVAHFYVPYDLPSAVGRFLDRVKPHLVLIMETELWPTMFHICKHRHVPIVIANMRVSEGSAEKYGRFAGLTRSTLAQVSALAVQSRADAERVIALGAPASAVRVLGSIKFDVDLPATLHEQAVALRRSCGEKRPVWVAASTHEGEETQVLAAFTQLRARIPDLLLILVPRHPERFGAVARLCARGGFAIALRSQQPPSLPAEVAILVGDTMGELLLFYACADIAYIGGSLVPTGGQNLLEAAALGVPAVFGPHMFNFREIAALALARRAATRVRDAAELARVVGDYLEDADKRADAGEAGRELVQENRGALQKTLALIEQTLPVHAD